MKSQSDPYDLDDLLYLMSRLRHPDKGCPWDLKQTFETILPYTLEEAYEVADAIEQGDRAEIRDELGDLLFQVVFYAQMAEEERSFSFADVVDGIVRKLVRRHPHVFPKQDLRAFHPDGTHFTDEMIKQQWETIKAQERALKRDQSQSDDPKKDEFVSLLEDIPGNLPSLNRAEKLQKRASINGFDWQDLPPVLEKLEEEIAELKEVISAAGDGDLRAPATHDRLLDEMGDIFFCCVNLARFVKVNPDEALRSANRKFAKRFTYIEKALLKRDVSVRDASLEEMETLWNKAKLDQD